MTESRAQRTLVKSPPELWAEVSDVEALAKHLGEFGEIRITRLEPETTVAWEGDTARGTVELAASGWGTKVTLTAEPVVVEEPLAEASVVEEPVAEAPEPAPETPEPVAEAPEPAPEPDPEPLPPAAAAPKPGFFARLFGRRREAPEPVAEAPAAGAPEPAPAPEPVAHTPAPEPEALVPDEPQAPEGELRAGEPVAGRTADGDRAVAILTAVLDDLGAAHHRPFSRG